MVPQPVAAVKMKTRQISPVKIVLQLVQTRPYFACALLYAL